MKFWILVCALAGIMAGTMESAAASAPVDLKAVLQKPFITGASVSADFGTPSPGRRLALRYTKSVDIKTYARPGTPGVETLKKVSAADLKDRTSVLALDLFFWDSVQENPSASIAAMKKFIAEVQQLHIPLVIGEIPELLPGRQASRAKLNEAIQANCLKANQCFIMPFDQLHHQLMKDGYLEIKGKRMTLKSIVPDGLHLSEPASEFLADRLGDTLRG